MYSKINTKKVITKHGKNIAESLGLSRWSIKYHVYKSGAKELKDLKVRFSNHTGNSGVSFIGDNKADIILFYDNLDSESQAVDILFHEHLHLFFYNLLRCVTIKEDEASRLEEKMVRRLETLYYKTLRRK